MALLIAVFVAAVLLTIVGGALAHHRGVTILGGPSRWGAAAAARFGRWRGAVLVVVSGLVALAVVCLPLGLLAKYLESGVDRPIFHWVQRHVSDGTFTTMNARLTILGDAPTTELAALVAFIVLTCAYQRRWWIPACAIAASFLGEEYLRMLLGKIIDRGHPPTAPGTYPSGGVGRVLSVYGTIIILVIILMPALSRAWRAGLWTGLATAAVIEAFTRLDLSKHWFTDALFGLPFGGLIVLTNVAAVSALAHSRVSTAPHPAHPPD